MRGFDDKIFPPFQGEGDRVVLANDNTQSNSNGSGADLDWDAGDGWSCYLRNHHNGDGDGVPSSWGAAFGDSTGQGDAP